MIDACVNMIVRNGEEHVRQAIMSVAPYVKRVVVTIDHTSSDKTRGILQSLRLPNVEVDEYKVINPETDLVAMRNMQLGRVKEKWVWIIDSDEIYPSHVMEGVAKYLEDENAPLFYAFNCWTPLDSEYADSKSSNAVIPRIYRMHPGMKWYQLFGHERIHKKKDVVPLLPFRYLHMTNFKKDTWREEMNRRRRFFGKKRIVMPDDIKQLIKTLW